MSARLQSALEAQVAAGAPGALARIEAISPTIDWAGGGLVTTTADLARFARCGRNGSSTPARLAS